MSGGRRVTVWAWSFALVPLSILTLAVTSSFATRSLREHFGAAKPPGGASGTALLPSASAPRRLAGEAVDLSSVMGRARKLADEWQREAALLGIEAVLAQGKVPTHQGASAKLTFGPSRFAPEPSRPELFVVVYDHTGFHAARAPGQPSKALPEPMCAPEHVLLRLDDRGQKPRRLRYGFDSDERALWFVTLPDDPQALSVYDPRDCSQRGNQVVVPRFGR